MEDSSIIQDGSVDEPQNNKIGTKNRDAHLVKRNELKTSKKWILLLVPAIIFILLLSGCLFLIRNGTQINTTATEIFPSLKP